VTAMEGMSGRTVGVMLRGTREERKLTVAQVNAATKISPHVIRALEEDDYGFFASDTYLKGHLRNYAAYLGLDGDRLWGALSRKRGDSPDGTGTFWDIEETMREEKLVSRNLITRLVLPLLLLAVLVLALLFVRERRRNAAAVSGGAAGQTVDVWVMPGGRAV
jgi:cytoskeletal protein RodZ